MFANFEVFSRGLVSVAPKPQYQRASRACLECRRRKKKCDQQIPICRLCIRYGTKCDSTSKVRRRSTPLSQLSTPPHLSPNAVLSLPSIPQASSSTNALLNDVSSLDDEPTVLSPTVVPRGAVAPEAKNPSSTGHLALTTSLQPSIMTSFSLPREQRAFRFIVAKFEDLLNPSHVLSRLPILDNLIPLAIESPLVRAALIACALALLARTSNRKEDELQAKAYQCNAVQGLANTLLEHQDEENIATVLLLHGFEKITCDSLTSKRLHLQGVSAVISSALARNPTKFNSTYLEIFIFHMSLSSTFSGARLGTFSDDYVSKLLDLWFQKEREHSKFEWWTTRSILGICHGIFDIIFRTSVLRQKLPLSKYDEMNAIKLKNDLEEWRIDGKHGPSSCKTHGTQAAPENLIRTSQLYRLGCHLLLEKILDNTLQAQDSIASDIVDEACEILFQMPSEYIRQSILLWPLLVLSSAARTEIQQTAFLAAFEPDPRSRNYSLGLHSQGYDFLNWCWAPKNDLDQNLGLDILLREDLMCQIFI